MSGGMDMGGEMEFLFYWGLALVAAGLVIWLRHLFRRMRCPAYATGEIVKIEDAEMKTKRLVVRFTVGGEEMILQEKRQLAGSFRGREGDRVSVRYDPGDPKAFFVEENRIHRVLYRSLIWGGLFLSVAALLLMGPDIYRLPFGRELLRLRWLIRNRWFRSE